MTNEEQNLLITYLVDLEEQFMAWFQDRQPDAREVRYKAMSSSGAPSSIPSRDRKPESGPSGNRVNPDGCSRAENGVRSWRVAQGGSRAPERSPPVLLSTGGLYTNASTRAGLSTVIARITSSENPLRRILGTMFSRMWP